MEAFRARELVTDDPPIVAVNANAGNPHYEPHASHPVPIREGDLRTARCVGQEEYAGRGVLRHYLDGICRQGSVGPHARGISRSCAMPAMPG